DPSFFKYLIYHIRQVDKGYDRMLPVHRLVEGQKGRAGDMEVAKLVVSVHNVVKDLVVAFVELLVQDRGEGDALGRIVTVVFCHIEADVFVGVYAKVAVVDVLIVPPATGALSGDGDGELGRCLLDM